MSTTKTTYTPAEMAILTSLSIPTLHYYEQIGLLDPVARAENGHRRYDEADLRRVDFLKRVRATGMSISEMQTYVELFRMGDSTQAQRRQILEQHKQSILAHIAELEGVVAFLDGKISNYRQQEQQQEQEQQSSPE